MKDNEEEKSLLEKLGATDYFKNGNKNVQDKKPQWEFIQIRPNKKKRKMMLNKHHFFI